MTRETCATCRFWLKLNDAGECRRYPRSNIDGLKGFAFPGTYADDWCGEHQPVAPAPAAPDDYTRAAVRYAEAEMRVGRLGYSPAAIDERTAAAYEYERLYFERERRDAG